MTESETNAQLQAAEALLKEAQLSYVRHEEGRREPFNLFTVLRSESDEVRLHSRFLAALLNHRKAPGEARENLKDFLETVAEQWQSETDNAGYEALKATVENSDFKSNSIRVQRESDNIDILITNRAEQKWAVAIENKIWAGDQPQQLQRYYDLLKRQGYDDIHMVYLEPYGRDPPEDSSGQLDIACISYKDTLPGWLERCRQRACDEPELRESVAQYLHLVRKLTGTDRGREYMSELKELLLKESNNLVLAHHLSEVMFEIRADLVRELWKDIENALSTLSNISDFPRKNEKRSNLEVIDNYVRGTRGAGKFGLYYPFGDDHAILYAEVNHFHDYAIIIGLRFSKAKSKEQRERYVESGKLKELRGHFGTTNEWVWYRYIGGAPALRNPTANHLKVLSNEAERARIVDNVVQPMREAWELLKPT